jgi:hypothetical protein
MMMGFALGACVGVRVRQGDAFVSYAEVGLPVPLPNPATIDIQGTLVYFQVFYISSTPTSHFAAAHDDADFSTITGAPKKKGHKSSSAGIAPLLHSSSFFFFTLLPSLFASDSCGVVWCRMVPYRVVTCVVFVVCPQPISGSAGRA